MFHITINTSGVEKLLRRLNTQYALSTHYTHTHVYVYIATGPDGTPAHIYARNVC